MVETVTVSDVKAAQNAWCDALVTISRSRRRRALRVPDEGVFATDARARRVRGRRERERERERRETAHARERVRPMDDARGKIEQ